MGGNGKYESPTDGTDILSIGGEPFSLRFLISARSTRGSYVADLRAGAELKPSSDRQKSNFELFK